MRDMIDMERHGETLERRKCIKERVVEKRKDAKILFLANVAVT